MKIVISPAKSLDFSQTFNKKEFTQNVFEAESQLLVNQLKKLSKNELGSLMKLSPKLTDLNHERFEEWRLPFTLENAKPAGAVFTGEVYKGLDLKSLSDKSLDKAQQSLRILSGLYGVLKPLDLIQPYRLEMGTKLLYNATIKNLYQFWDNKITDQLNKELKEDDGILVNLASNEYFKAVKHKQIDGEVVTCNFKENKDGAYKIIAIYAKNARGKMSRYIIENDLKKKEELMTFDVDGYIFNPRLSSDNDFVFTRN